MKKVIQGKVYNTETATIIANFKSNLSQSDFNFENTNLFKTKKGNYFLQGEGHANSRWAAQNGNTRSWGDGIQIISENEAKLFAEKYLDLDSYESFFETEEA